MVNISISNPPGRRKIIKSLRLLLDEKNFSSITTAEIAKTAGVTEGLIYKYFKDKRDLLYQVLEEHFKKFLSQTEKDLEGVNGALEKLKVFLMSGLQSYANHRVFARIVILEVRNSPDYYESDAYQLVRKYNQIILEIIEEGMKNGEIRDDVEPSYIRHVIFGSIEQSSLKRAIFNEETSSYDWTRNTNNSICSGVVMHKWSCT